MSPPRGLAVYINANLIYNNFIRRGGFLKPERLTLFCKKFIRYSSIA